MYVKVRIATLWTLCLLVLIDYVAAQCIAEPVGTGQNSPSRHASRKQPAPVLLALEPNYYYHDVEMESRTSGHSEPDAKWLLVKGKNFKRGASLAIEDPISIDAGSSRYLHVPAEYVSATMLRVPFTKICKLIMDTNLHNTRDVKISVANPDDSGTYPGLFSYTWIGKEDRAKVSLLSHARKLLSLPTFNLTVPGSGAPPDWFFQLLSNHEAILLTLDADGAAYQAKSLELATGKAISLAALNRALSRLRPVRLSRSASHRKQTRPSESPYRIVSLSPNGRWLLLFNGTGAVAVARDGTRTIFFKRHPAVALDDNRSSGEDNPTPFWTFDSRGWLELLEEHDYAGEGPSYQNTYRLILRSLDHPDQLTDTVGFITLNNQTVTPLGTTLEGNMLAWSSGGSLYRTKGGSRDSSQDPFLSQIELPAGVPVGPEIQGILLSPQGDRLLIHRSVRAPQERQDDFWKRGPEDLMVYDIHTKTTRYLGGLVPKNSENAFSLLRWTPDGAQVIFAANKALYSLDVAGK